MSLYEETYQFLKGYGQEHALRFWSELSEEERETLARQVREVDFSTLTLKESGETLGKITPIQGLSREALAARREEFFEIGKKAIVGGKVVAVLLAGGQGTRLGSDAPKGTFNVGVTRELSIFSLLVKNLTEVWNACGQAVPLLIMTSEKNDGATKEFFEKNGHFGYPKEKIRFFKQEMAACADENGKLLLEEKGRISSSPNGNGGWYSSLVRAGLLNDALLANVEWFNVFSVDNVLQRIADPVFLGATIQSGCLSGAKVVKKAAPEERVGVLCLENGAPRVVEYYELPAFMAKERDQDGELTYRYGVTLNYLLSAQKLRETLDEKIPLHVAKKAVPYLNDEGVLIKPDAPNAYKFETLILDMIKLMGTCVACEIDREKEFAPVKNKTGVDSVETARALLEKNGVKL